MQRLEAGADGAIRLAVGEVIEETAELVNPEGRTHIALRLPLAAGLEPLNPNIATAPAEATPSAPPSLPPSFVSFGDDEVRYFWDQLPAGTYQVHFRLRATVAGTFTSPPGEAETMYRNDVYGASAGQQIIVARCPFIFALALHSGRLTPADVMEDLPEGAAGIGNADRNFLGPLLPRQALANSRNVPAANLLRKVGLDSGFEFFRDLGLHRLDAAAQSFGLSMAIGSLPTSLDRLLRAYEALADEGMLRDLVWYDGQPTAPARRLLSADVARQVTLFLSDPLARLPSFPRYGTTEFPFAVALKTGTSQGYRDAWTVLWSRDYMIGVWLGRADAGTMREVSGARVAAGLAKALALRLHGTRAGDLSDTGFAPPAGHVPVELCVFTGQHNPSGCSETLVEWLPAKAAPATGFPVAEAAPDSAEPVRLSIAAPEQNVHLWRNPEAPASLNRLALRAVAQPHVAQIVWYVDGEPFAVADPHQTVYWPMLPGHHRFQIRQPFGDTASKPVRIAVE